MMYQSKQHQTQQYVVFLLHPYLMEHVIQMLQR